MKRRALIAALLATLVVPAVAMAQDGAGQDRANAARTCKAQKTSMGEALFRQTYGTAESNHRNAMGKCVSRAMAERKAARQTARAACAAERGPTFRTCVAAKMGATLTAGNRETVNAARRCKAERRTMGEAAFRAEYGKNASDRNAFGKCVSKKTA
jgi:hypothetical protein